MIESVTITTPEPGIWVTTVQLYWNRTIDVYYLNLPADEIKVQHALGTALWHVHCYRPTGEKFASVIPVIARSSIEAAHTVEFHYRDQKALVYRVEEVLVND
ncbi:hypothetical protein LCGC14_1039500 [marine sediment metagenome]|uniref:Uncharacterized protein n=1 Tax=marine sediment metagenome TaxID=412755 RepID=A0A0F9NDV6_9ZZZZ